MRVELLADYRGVLTNEVYYLAGVCDLPDNVANGLIREGRAVACEQPAAEPERKTAVTKRGRK